MWTAPAAAVEDLLGLPLVHLIEVGAKARICKQLCSQQHKPKSLNSDHARKSQDMQHEPFLQVGTSRVVPRYAYHRTFTVKFPDKCVCGRRNSNHIVNGVWPGMWTGPRPAKAVLLGYVDRAWEGGIVSALVSSQQYARLKYTSLMHV